MNKDIAEILSQATKELEKTEEYQQEKNQLLEDIKNGKELNLQDWNNLSLSDLLTKDENNITYLEYACKDKQLFYANYRIKLDIYKNLEAMYICAKNNYIRWVDFFDYEDIFFEKIDGEKLIDYIFNNNIEIGYFFFIGFKKHAEIIDYILKKDKKYLNHLSPELAESLLTKQNGTYPVDKYIDIPEVKKFIAGSAPKESLIKYCLEKENYDLLKNAKEAVLLSDNGKGKRIIEELLDRKIDPTFYEEKFTSKETLDILLKRNRIDLLYNAELSLLLSKYDNKITYLELMIEKQKEGMDMHLEKMSFNYHFQPTEMLAQELIILARNDMHVFVPEITKEMLLHRGKFDKRSVIQQLVSIDKETTASKIIPKCQNNKDPDLVIVLKNLGIEDTPIKHTPKDPRFSEQYIEKINEEYDKDCESICPRLLDYLKILFSHDGKSDEKLVDALIKSYTFLTSTNHPNNQLFMQELKQLIEIKKHNLAFTYEKIDDGGFFSESEGIRMDSAIIGTINHETSHALHYFLAGDYIPENYFEVIERARNNPDIISKVKEYSEKLTQLKEKIKSEISKSKIQEFYNELYKGDRLLELSLFLGMSKEKQKQKLIEDYQEQVLDTILASTYSVEEFMSQRIEIEKDETTDSIVRSYYDSLIAIGDIVDAIFMGKFKNGALHDYSNEEIKPTYGHGISYFSHKNKGFMEMIADYGSIIKSKNCDQMIKYLRSIVGDEVVDMIKEVYENNILQSNVYQEMEERGHAR